MMFLQHLGLKFDGLAEVHYIREVLLDLVKGLLLF